jgi:hypothetical protein
MRVRVRVATGLGGLMLAGALGGATPRYSDWSAPMPLDAVNTPELEFASAVSRDGLSFYFQRGDVAVSGEDLWVAHRASRKAPWGAPQPLPATVNSAFNERGAFVSKDGHWLFFSSDRPGGRGDFDLLVSWRAHVHDDLGWEEAQNLDDLGSPVNTPGFDSGPALLENEESGQVSLYLVSNPDGPRGPAVDLYVSLRNEDGSFGPPTKVEELSHPTAQEGRPYLRKDGREIFFNSNRPGSLGGQDIWTSRRECVSAPWSSPEPVDELNTVGNDFTPALSWDGQTLFFAGTHLGRFGEILFSTRGKKRGHR